MIRLRPPIPIPTAIPWMVVGFLAGVLAHAGSPFERFPLHVSGIGAAVAIGVAWMLPRAWRLGIMAVVVGCIAGFLRFDFTIPVEAPVNTFEGIVVNKGKYDVLVRDIASGVGIKISSTRPRIGEHVRITCGALQPLDTTDEFATYNARRGAWFTCKSPSISASAHQGDWDPQQTLLRWRQTLTWRIQRILPGDPGALLSGILYGERNLAPETSDRFRAAGMTHLIAVSGSNIALVVALFVPIFLMIGYRRKPAIILSGIAITGFVIFVGAEASVVRAAVMGWLALLARVFGRKASAGRLLVVAAAAIVAIDPWALAFDAGFALSFLATWGLLTWANVLQEKCRWMPQLFGLREAFATTLAATFITTPYSLWAFEQVSLAGLLTNLLAVPLVGLAMFWGTVALVAGELVPWLALPAKGALEAMLLISRLADLLPWLQRSYVVPTWGLFIWYSWLWFSNVRHRSGENNYPHAEQTELNFGALLPLSVGKR